MTNLVANKPRTFRGERVMSSIDVEASTNIFQGAAIEEGSNGGAQNLTGAGTTFLGLSLEEGLNGSGALGGKRVTFAGRGVALLYVDHNSVAIARTAVGAAVYASDGDTFTTVSTSNQQIGKVVEVPPETVGATAGWLWVAFEGAAFRSI